jgi:PDGLE domain
MKVRPGFGMILLTSIAVIVGLVVFVSPGASREPDGLNRVAIDQGFDTAEQEHALADLPTAGYAVSGVDDDRLSTGLAGLLGVGLTFAVAGGVVVVARRFPRRAGREETGG